MAKKSYRRKSRRKITALKASITLALSTLADDTIIGIAGPTLTQAFNVVSTEMVVTVRGHATGENPIDYGLNQSVLTTTEVLEALDASPTSETDVPAIEHTKRKVRQYGTLIEEPDGTDLSHNDGNPVRMKMFMKVPNGIALPEIWFRNRSGAALAGADIAEIQIKYFGYWV